MEVSGQIIKKNEDLGYGFISVKGSDDIFFSPESGIAGTEFSGLRVGDKVKVIVVETDRGLFAKSIVAAVVRKQTTEPEAVL